MTGFGKRARIMRLVRGWSQIEAAKVLGEGVEQSLLSMIERGTVMPGGELASRIRNAYGWTAEVDAALDALAEALGCEEQAIEQGRAG